MPLEGKTRPLPRIHRILEKLETVWLECPDFRLCQLLMSLAADHPTWPDLFYFEDTKLEQEIDKAIAEQAKLPVPRLEDRKNG